VNRLRRGMKVEISSKSFHASEKLIDFTDDKISKIIKAYPGISSVLVVLILKKNCREKARVCKISLAIGPAQIVVERNTDSFEASVLEVVNIISRNLARAKQMRELT
jgi:ribosome-associated translation inhibitor RaiA